MNVESLLRELRASVAAALVDQLAPQAFRVLVPTARSAHELVAVSVEQTQDGWIISDGGYLSYQLGNQLEAVVDVIRCSMDAEVELLGQTLVRYVTSEAEVPAAVLSFAYQTTFAGDLEAALACARNRSSAEVAAPVVDLMAREMRSRMLDRLGKQTGGVIHLGQWVSGQAERAKAPLAISPPSSKLPPPLVAGFVDTAASPQAVTSAKKNVSFLLDVLSGIKNTSRFVVVRGEQDDIERLSDIYEHEGAITVSTEDPAALLDEARVVIDRMGLAHT
jgi:hypothetical protein